MKNIILCILFQIITCFPHEQGVCIVPVADLAGAPLTDPDLYQSLPMNGDGEIVKRIGQLLFNETASIIKESDEEVCIQVPHHFYCTNSDKTPQNTFWTLKKNLLLLKEVPDITGIPTPISYKKNLFDNKNSITLKKPFFDKLNKRLYSAGTRFKLIAKNDTRDSYNVFSLSKNLLINSIEIPCNKCLKPNNYSPNQKIKLFVKRLRKLAQKQIPYVLGGVSYVESYPSHFYEKKTDSIRFFIAKKNPSLPYSGFDCASLIYRVAQMVGLPFYMRNSSAMYNYLRPLNQGERVENGDIIFIPGHIIALVDIENNRIVEARTQSHGYGFVHEIDLSLLFKEIDDIQDLIKFHFSKEKASRLDRNGTVIGHKPITILKLRSIFE